MTPAFRLTLIWIVGCILTFVVAMNFMPASFVDGHYIPVSNDSFYHARRILDTVAHPDAFYEFDPFIHYPEGSWITWPWGYDYGMAQIVRATIAIFGPRDPMAVLAFIPVFAITITIGLVLAIASALRLTMPMRALVVFTFGVSPLTQTLHGVGMVDHHFAEHICILLSVLLGILWLREPSSTSRATALGVALGSAVAIHNGLFVLQLPILAALLVQWLRGEPLERRSVTRFSVSLFVSTLLVALPAQALRNGVFEFYLLSWFHVYVAGCSAIIAALFARWSYSPRRLITFGAIALALIVPLGAQVIMGGTFIAGQSDALQGIDEVQSPLRLAFSAAGASRISQLYGLLLWLSPISLCVSVAQLVRERRPEFRYFWIICTGTLILMLFQLRFFYYGTIALYIVPFWCLDRLRTLFPRYAKTVLAGSLLLALVAPVPSFRSILYQRAAPSLDLGFANARSLFTVLAQACRKAPGLALGDSNQGHYIRYFTDCYVLANNFRLTQQHAEKLQRLDHLYELTPEQLLIEGPEVRYVLVLLTGPYMVENGIRRASTESVLRQINKRLTVDLLLTREDQLPARFHALSKLALPDVPFPVAALYEIGPAGPQMSHANPAP